MITFTVSNKTLSDALAMVSKVVAAKNVLPILNDIIFKVEKDKLWLTGADVENQLTTSIDITDVQEEGEFAINAKDIMEAVKNMPDMSLTFSREDNANTMKIDYFSGEFSLPIDDTDEFPKMVDINESEVVCIGIIERILQENIARTVFATADDELRPVMNGICFDLMEDGLNVVASDGHQLVRNKVLNADADKQGSFVLPKKPALILKNILKKGEDMVNIKADDRRIEVQTEAFTLNSRLIEGRYPNYNSVIPKQNPNILTINRQTLIAALRRVSPFSDNGSRLVRMHVEPGKVELRAEDFDFAKSATEQMACNYNGSSMNIGFKGVSVIEILTNISASEIELHLADPSRAALIMPATQPEGQEITMLQMPMLIND